jgi:hypothetical protein
VLAFLSPISSLCARGGYGFLWSLTHPQVRLVADDWQIKTATASYGTFIKNVDKFFNHPVISFRYKDEANIFKDILIKKACQLYTQPESFYLISPVFKPGFDMYRRATQLKFKHLLVDPTHLFDDWYKQEIDELTSLPIKRDRHWINASLLDKSSWLKKQHFSWPVSVIGNKRVGQPRLHEVEIVKRYCQAWGVLSPSHNFGGWWRARYQLAARCKSVLYGDKFETCVFGNSYLTSLDIIENLDDSSLRDLADRQARDFFARVASYEEALNQLSKALS